MRYLTLILLVFCLLAPGLLANDAVTGAARQYIINRFRLDPESITVSMRGSKSFDCMIPGDSLDVYAITDAPPRGSYSLKFDIVRDGAIIKTVSTSVDVSIWEDVYTATRRIKRGEPVSLSDLAVERRDITRVFDKVVTSAGDFDGMRASKSIHAGKPIERDLLEPIPVINRGDEVVIKCDVGALEISTTGIAKEDGLAGDQITVQNKDTNQRINAEVLSPGVVIVRR
jgi:flagella basal body P-ring formation protein FlgA